MEKRANEVLERAFNLLKEIEKQGLFKTIENGIFAGIKRPIDGGKGLNGVFKKDEEYFNPLLELMKNELTSGGN